MVKKTYLKYGKVLAKKKKKKNLGKKILLVWQFHPTLHLQCQSGIGTTVYSFKSRNPHISWYLVSIYRKAGCSKGTKLWSHYYKREHFFSVLPTQMKPNFLLSVSFSQIPIQMIAQSPRFILHCLIHKIAKTSFGPLENCMSAVSGLQTRLICEVHHCHFCHTVASLKLLFLPSPFRGHC